MAPAAIAPSFCTEGRLLAFRDSLARFRGKGVEPASFSRARVSSGCCGQTVRILSYCDFDPLMGRPFALKSVLPCQPLEIALPKKQKLSPTPVGLDQPREDSGKSVE